MGIKVGGRVPRYFSRLIYRKHPTSTLGNQVHLEHLILHLLSPQRCNTYTSPHITTMHRTTLLSTLALALASRALAQGLDTDDIAPNCASQCSAIVTTSDACERQYDDTPNEDQNELDCICSANGMSSAIPECEACQRQYYAQDDDYDDIRELLRRCGFSSISAGMTMTGMAAAPTGGSTTVITSTYTERDDDDDDDDIDLEVTTITSVLPTDAPASTTADGGAGAGSAATSGSEALGSATDAAGQAAQDQTGNLAPAMTAAPVLAVAGVAAAVFGL